jgi:hypothetical protein
MRFFMARWASGDLLSSFAHGVGHVSDPEDEDALALMRRADFLRREESSLNRETQPL